MLRASSKRESREAELSIWQISLHVIYRVKYSSRDAQLTEMSALSALCTHARTRNDAGARVLVHESTCSLARLCTHAHVLLREVPALTHRSETCTC